MSLQKQRVHMKNYLALIDISTTPRCDVTPLFAAPGALRMLAEDLAEPFAAANIDAVAAVDALGFIAGTAVAGVLGVGVVALRKGGKLAGQNEGESFVDYSGTQKRLEVRPFLVLRSMRFLIVDEWIESGAQVSAAARLIERLGGVVAGIATINVDTCAQTQALKDKYHLHALWTDGQ